MHSQALEYVRTVLQQAGPKCLLGRVVEWGSLNINGSVRELFPDAQEYVGVDVAEGPGVDWVGWAHDFPLETAGEFDVSVSTEMLEHDPFWEKSLDCMVKALRPGGLLVGTCAGPGRGEHGTLRNAPGDSPVIARMAEYEDYYRNISVEEMVAGLRRLGVTRMNVAARDTDLQFMGYR